MVKRLPKNSNFYPVILAGGRGTRFWPLSRKKRAKQLLVLDGKQGDAVDLPPYGVAVALEDH